MSAPYDYAEEVAHIEPMGAVEYIHYVMNLEELVRWLARTYSYEDQEGNYVQQEPIWPTHDEQGEPLEANQRLIRTWRRVFE